MLKKTVITHFKRSASLYASYIKLVVPVVLLILVVLSFAVPAAKAAKQTMRVSPVIINVSLSPGKTYTHEVTVENITDAPMPLRATLNDFITAGEDGGYIFETTRTNPLLSWITLSETEFIINPNEKKTITMTIKTPKSIALGGYYGVLFFEPVLQKTISNGAMVSSKVGVLMLANVGVPDPAAQKAEILTFSTNLLDDDGNLPLLLRVKNISLNFFTAKPMLTLTPLLSFNQTANTKTVTLEDKLTFPGQTRRWTEEAAAQELSPNIYKAAMAVSTGNGQFIITEKFLVVFPFTKAALFTTGVFLLAFIFVKRKQLKKAVEALYK